MQAASKLILFGEASLRRALREYVVHHHEERNRQGKGNVLQFPAWGQHGYKRCENAGLLSRTLKRTSQLLPS